MKIYLASDNAGFELKNFIYKELTKINYDVEDCGPYELDPKDDYPDYIIPAAKKVASLEDSRGIIMGGSGQGEAIAANRIKGIRAVVYYDGPLEIIKLSRNHNNAIIISFGARFISNVKVKEVLNIWLNEEFEAGRHIQRINKLNYF